MFSVAPAAAVQQTEPSGPSPPGPSVVVTAPPGTHPPGMAPSAALPGSRETQPGASLAPDATVEATSSLAASRSVDHQSTGVAGEVPSPDTTLTEAETFLMIRVCVDNWPVYGTVSETDFFEQARAYFFSKTGRVVKDIRERMAALVAIRRKQILAEGATALHSATERVRALDIWIKLVTLHRIRGQSEVKRAQRVQEELRSAGIAAPPQLPTTQPIKTGNEPETETPVPHVRKRRRVDEPANDRQEVEPADRLNNEPNNRRVEELTKKDSAGVFCRLFTRMTEDIDTGSFEIEGLKREVTYLHKKVDRLANELEGLRHPQA